MFDYVRKKVVISRREIYSIKPIQKGYLDMDWKGCWISFNDGALRFLCALLWLALLCSFSFFDLLNFMVHTSDHSISMEIVKEMQSLKMIVANIGLIGMAYIDNVLSSMLANKGKETWTQKLVMLCAIIVAIYLSLTSQGIDIDNPDFRWRSLPAMLFAVYLVCLLIYKMQSLEVVHSKGREF